MNGNNMFKEVGKKLAKKGGKHLLKLLAPYLPVIGLAFLIFMLLAMLVGAVYSAFPDTKGTDRKVGILADNEVSGQDEEMYKEYTKQVNKYNVEDTWLVFSEPTDPNFGDGQNESTPAATFYPNTFEEKTGALVDRYGNDHKLRLLWSQVHTSALYRAYSLNEDHISDATIEKVTKDEHPYFYYKRSKVIRCSKDGDIDIEIVYLLVEAYTIQGHYQYHYKWKTVYSTGGGSTTFEELTDTKQILPNKWQRLEDWIKKEFKTTDEIESSALARAAVWEASEGYYKKQEWLAWLTSASGASWVSGAMVPAELKPYFEEASQKYGIPAWFLEAIALKESSFDPQAENPTTGCYGLMQVSPANWKEYAPRLGFDPILDKDNPRAQIMVGTYMLYELGLKNVDWDSPNWKEQTLDVLVFYGGFRGSDAKERCRKEYAEAIWAYGDQFKNTKAVWPAPGYTEIGDGFGMRYHPILGYDKLHEGIDIPMDYGATVVSVSGGIAYVTDNGKEGYGLQVVVKDGTHEYLYAHLQSASVVSGQTVTPGQEIGKAGSSGLSTGPHLHFGVYLLDGTPIDPLLILFA